MIKTIILSTSTVEGGPYLTSGDAYKLVDRLKTVFNIPKELGLYSDGQLHIGTECSKIYKQLFPSGVLRQNELCYLKLTHKLCSILDANEIAYNAKSLKTKGTNNAKYVQLISLDILAIYLGGKFKLTDDKVHEALAWVTNHKLRLKTSNSSIIAGNKPVDIEGKPLVKILNEKSVETELPKCKTTNFGVGLGVTVDSDAPMTYVKTGPLMRKDIYIALKTIAAQENKHLYEVLEDVLLGNSNYNLGLLTGGEL